MAYKSLFTIRIHGDENHVKSEYALLRQLFNSMGRIVDAPPPFKSPRRKYAGSWLVYIKVYKIGIFELYGDGQHG